MPEDPGNGHFGAFCVQRHEKVPRTSENGNFLCNYYNILQAHPFFIKSEMLSFFGYFVCFQ
jgi:hypothetical protein